MKITAAIFSTAIILFTGKSFAQSVDYSKCANFVNPQQHKKSMGFPQASMGGTMGYLPFKLNEDGSVEPHRDVVRYKQDSDKNQEVMVYEVPDYQAMMSKPNDQMSNPFKQPMRQAKVIVQRDEDGHIKEIINDQNLSEDRLKEQRQAGIEAYESRTPESIKSVRSRWDSKELFLPFNALKQVKVSFDVEDGECSPSSSQNVTLTEPSLDGDTREDTNFDVQVCRDIKDFMEKNPEAGACFKKSLNNQISSIFKDHHKRLTEGKEHARGFGGEFGRGGSFGGGGGGGFGGGLGMGVGSLEMKLFLASTSSNSPERFQKMMGNSPVIEGHKILESCKSSGLAKFLDGLEETKTYQGRSQSSSESSESR